MSQPQEYINVRNTIKTGEIPKHQAISKLAAMVMQKAKIFHRISIALGCAIIAVSCGKQDPPPPREPKTLEESSTKVVDQRMLESVGFSPVDTGPGVMEVKNVKLTDMAEKFGLDVDGFKMTLGAPPHRDTRVAVLKSGVLIATAYREVYGDMRAEEDVAIWTITSWPASARLTETSGNNP